MEFYGTLGPACARETVLMEMFQAGMTGIRLNLSHRSLKDSREWIEMYHKSAEKCGIKADLLIDLIGPEIRIGNLAEPIKLKEREQIFLGGKKIPVPEYIPPIAEKGQRILLDDGKIEVLVEEAGEKELLCTVARGGILHSRKSLAMPGVTVNNPTLTEMDYENLKDAKEFGVTAVMLPFVRGKEDLICLKETLQFYDSGHIRIFAKIENMEGVEKLPELLPYCDHIVIARGDLGNAVPLTRLPVIQQQISDLCKKEGKPFMVVTQMLHSMIENPVPTRAEVTDIFHAVKEGASSVMLTGETAAGKYPVEAVKVLAETGKEALRFIINGR